MHIIFIIELFISYLVSNCVVVVTAFKAGLLSLSPELCGDPDYCYDLGIFPIPLTKLSNIFLTAKQ